MNATLTRRYHFEAAHRLPHHDGKCRHLHGHSYTLAIQLHGRVVPVAPGIASHPVTISPTLEPSGSSSVGIAHVPETAYRPDVGMVMDFADLDTIVQREVIERLDHAYLNDVLDYPTAEHIAAWIWRALDTTELGASTTYQLVALTLDETARGSVTITRPDLRQ